MTDTSTRSELASVTRALGEPARSLVVLAEGNTSLVHDSETFWLKASGVRMSDCTEEDFVRMRARPLIDLLDGGDLDESELKAAIAAARIEGGLRPSIEAILHALCLVEFGARAVAHTHPVAANGILCSDRARELAGGSLFPDQAVICGPSAVFVPYASPGIALARAVRAAITASVEHTGIRPRTVWLESHGLLALGDSSRDVFAITEMANKFAQVLGATLAIGEPRWLDAGEANALANRDDEVERRNLLAATA